MWTQWPILILSWWWQSQLLRHVLRFLDSRTLSIWIYEYIYILLYKMPPRPKLPKKPVEIEDEFTK